MAFDSTCGTSLHQRLLHEIEASGQPVQDGAQTLKSHSIQKKATRIACVLLIPNAINNRFRYRYRKVSSAGMREFEPNKLNIGVHTSENSEHRYRRGHGFHSRSSTNFFRFSFRNCFICVHNCDVYSLIHSNSLHGLRRTLFEKHSSSNLETLHFRCFFFFSFSLSHAEI